MYSRMTNSLPGSKNRPTALSKTEPNPPYSQNTLDGEVLPCKGSVRNSRKRSMVHCTLSHSVATANLTRHRRTGASRQMMCIMTRQDGDFSQQRRGDTHD